MRLVMTNEFLAEKLEDKEALRLIKEAGFDGVDFSLYRMKQDEDIFNGDGYREYAKELRAYLDEIGLPVLQAHAPFPAYRGDRDFEENNKKMMPRVLRSIEIASILGAPHIVVHPVMTLPPEVKEDLHSFNLWHFREMIPYAEKYGVKLAIENTFGWEPKRDVITWEPSAHPEVLHQYIDELGDDNFCILFDTGHACLPPDSEPDEMLRRIGGKRLKGLHVHDNNYRGDYHQLPYTGLIDWNAVTAALGEIGYEGDFTFETDTWFFKNLDKALYPAALRYMNELGRHLIGLVQKHKNI